MDGPRSSKSQCLGFYSRQICKDKYGACSLFSQIIFCYQVCWEQIPGERTGCIFQKHYWNDKSLTEGGLGSWPALSRGWTIWLPWKSLQPKLFHDYKILNELRALRRTTTVTRWMGIDTEGEPLPTCKTAPSEHGKICKLVMSIL